MRTQRIARYFYVGQYGLEPSELLNLEPMESKDERRKRRLQQLAREKGGIRKIAEDAGVRWETLDQIIKSVELPEKKDGTRSARSVGDKLAETIEDAYDLGRGWFDWPFEFVDHKAFWGLSEPQRVIAQERFRQEIEKLGGPPPPPETVDDVIKSQHRISGQKQRVSPSIRKS